MSRASHQGFTLIEMLVTVAVSSILIGIAVPSIRDISIKNRLSAYANELVSAVNIARSEAVRRGSTVSVCKSNDEQTCSGSWSDGWIVFVDKDNDRVVDTGEDVLKIYDALTANYTIGADSTLANGFTYGADGATNNTGILAVCYEGDKSKARAIVLTKLRPRAARDTDADNIPNRDDNVNIASCTAPGA
jgi:type IV fimbrial biogenesis protein FimT